MNIFFFRIAELVIQNIAAGSQLMVSVHATHRIETAPSVSLKE